MMPNEWDAESESEHLPQRDSTIDEIWAADKMALVEYDDGERIGVLTAENPVSVRR